MGLDVVEGSKWSQVDRRSQFTACFQGKRPRPTICPWLLGDFKQLPHHKGRNGIGIGVIFFLNVIWPERFGSACFFLFIGGIYISKRPHGYWAPSFFQGPTLSLEGPDGSISCQGKVEVERCLQDADVKLCGPQVTGC